MRIAQVAPLAESVPPERYGGTERVVSYLTEELVRQGHEVTLFASGDSVTQARLVAVRPTCYRCEPPEDEGAHDVRLIDRAFDDSAQFDIMHFHTGYSHFPLACRAQTPNVTTMHWRLDVPDYVPLFRQFSQIPVVSISDDQREPLRFANWVGTVYNGLPEDLYTYHPQDGDYLAFVGRTSPEKGFTDAVKIARRAGLPLRVGAAVDTDHIDQVAPLLEDPMVEFLGEIGDAEKNELFGNAAALIFPVDWPEPFGMVMIESMACGTPVIAYRIGSVPEVLDDGVTGFIVDGADEAVEAVRRVHELSRERCREVFEERFTAAQMARGYVAVYERLLRARE